MQSKLLKTEIVAYDDAIANLRGHPRKNVNRNQNRNQLRSTNSLTNNTSQYNSIG